MGPNDRIFGGCFTTTVGEGTPFGLDIVKNGLCAGTRAPFDWSPGRVERCFRFVRSDGDHACREGNETLS
jgi:hypothetical protein